ncbi:hypothetical protein FRC05_007160 [Tulasnella sp. 425]|nr:hypothetical protein FRC05_007160 [Tulasnella sp. 425]
MNLVTSTARQAILDRNPNMKDYIHTSRWIKEMGEDDCPWEEYGERVFWVPQGPWTTELQADRVNRREFIAAQLQLEDFVGLGATLRPLLLASGNPEETVDMWIREMDAEVREMKAKIYIKGHLEFKLLMTLRSGRQSLRACMFICEVDEDGAK